MSKHHNQTEEGNFSKREILTVVWARSRFQICPPHSLPISDLKITSMEAIRICCLDSSDFNCFENKMIPRYNTKCWAQRVLVSKQFPPPYAPYLFQNFPNNLMITIFIVTCYQPSYYIKGAFFRVPYGHY